jgi:hypothetical protein
MALWHTPHVSEGVAVPNGKSFGSLALEEAKAITDEITVKQIIPNIFLDFIAYSSLER